MNNDKPLKLKYRPPDLDSFRGNKPLVESLRTLINRETGRPHCILFEGPSGCGKTTLARIIAREFGCHESSLIEYNISDMRGIDTARDIIDKSKYAPLSGDIKVYILNEVHQATPEFLNAALDILEEPPDHVYFILCTTEPEKIERKLKTIRGQRASVYKVKPLRKNEIAYLLKDVCKKEDVDFPVEHLNEIANVSQGSPRRALDILDQIIDIEDDEMAMQMIIDSTVSEVTIKELAEFLLSRESKDEKKLRKMLKNLDLTDSNSVEQIRLALKEWMCSVYLNNGNQRASKIMSVFLEPFYYSGRAGLVDAVLLASKL